MFNRAEAIAFVEAHYPPDGPGKTGAEGRQLWTDALLLLQPAERWREAPDHLLYALVLACQGHADRDAVRPRP